MVITELRFQHVVDLPRMDSKIATARDSRNKTHIYLIVNHNGPVYKRNGLRDVWDLIEEDSVRSSLRALLERAGSRIARYTTNSSSIS